MPHSSQGLGYANVGSSDFSDVRCGVPAFKLALERFLAETSRPSHLEVSEMRILRVVDEIRGSLAVTQKEAAFAALGEVLSVRHDAGDEHRISYQKKG